MEFRQFNGGGHHDGGHYDGGRYGPDGKHRYTDQ